MSKFITKEELLEAKCEAYKTELRKAEKLLGRANVLLMASLDGGFGTIFQCETRDTIESIHNYFLEED
jgi:hypothetical protein